MVENPRRDAERRSRKISKNQYPFANGYKRKKPPKIGGFFFVYII